MFFENAIWEASLEAALGEPISSFLDYAGVKLEDMYEKKDECLGPEWFIGGASGRTAFDPA